MRRTQKSFIRSIALSAFAFSTLIMLGACDSPASTVDANNATPIEQTSIDNQSVSSPLLDEANKSFSVNGKMISPLIIKRFIGFTSDPTPLVVGVNVERAQNSNEFECTSCIGETEVVLKNDEGETEGVFSYEYVGKTNNGIHVLSTESNEGGIFSQRSVLFLSFKTSEFYNYDSEKESQLLLTYEGAAMAGQEAGGEFIESTITIADNTVVIETQREKEEYSF